MSDSISGESSPHGNLVSSDAVATGGTGESKDSSSTGKDQAIVNTIRSGESDPHGNAVKSVK
jgi:hypothetical protein